MLTLQDSSALISDTRLIKTSSPISIIQSPPITKKPLEVRQGKGKGAVEYWVALIQPGRILYEMQGVDEDTAREALTLAAAKLPFQTTFIKRTVM